MGSGRSAREPSPSVSGRLVTWPTPTRTGVWGSSGMEPTSVPWRHRGAHRPSVHFGDADRRRLGSCGVRPEGRPWPSTWPTRGHQVVDLGTDSADGVGGLRRLRPGRGPGGGRGSGRAGVCVCGTGIGISMAANKVAGVRAALVHDVTTASLARRHNDANVICLGGRTLGSARGHRCRGHLLLHRVRGRPPPAAASTRSPPTSRRAGSGTPPRHEDRTGSPSRPRRKAATAS